MTQISYVCTSHDRGLRLGEALGVFVPAGESECPTNRLDSSLAPAVSVSEALLPRIAAGESDAVEQCLDRYGGLVWSLARRYFKRREEAEDAVQEAFLSLWENARRFDAAVAGEATFVAMIARRRLIDLVRRSTAQRRSAGAESSGADAPTPVEELAARDGGAVAHEGVTLRGFEVAEEAERVRVQMERLSEDQQRVLRLAICEGQSQTQIAEATGWPLGTVKSHARRGMKRLRELLEAPSTTTPATQEADR